MPRSRIAHVASICVIAIAVALPGYDVLYEAPAKPTALPARLYWQAPVPHLHVEFQGYAAS